MSSPSTPVSILCISTYLKGQPVLRELANLGCKVTLLTLDSLRNADWPRDSLAELLTMPPDLTLEQILNTVSFLARSRRIDRIIPLDEFDLEAAAHLREHMRLPGLNESTTRFVRDKLAMRVQAARANVAVPPFSAVFNYDDLRNFMREVPGPWLLKPRTNASAIGIRTIHLAEDLWPVLDQLGDQQSHYLLEKFIPGDVFHVEAVSWQGDLLFSAQFQYGRPPMETMHQGGVFTTRSLPRDSSDAKALATIHERLLAALGLQSAVTHSEFIRSAKGGEFFFLETAARVGGAYIADTVELATGLNPWVEWARLEFAAASGSEYRLPPVHQGFAGSVISLARQQAPDLSAYTDPEIAVRLDAHHHAGLILRTDDEKRLSVLLASYTERFLQDFCAVLPPPDKPTS